MSRSQTDDGSICEFVSVSGMKTYVSQPVHFSLSVHDLPSIRVIVKSPATSCRSLPATAGISKVRIGSPSAHVGSGGGPSSTGGGPSSGSTTSTTPSSSSTSSGAGPSSGITSSTTSGTSAVSSTSTAPVEPPPSVSAVHPNARDTKTTTHNFLFKSPPVPQGHRDIAAARPAVPTSSGGSA